MMGKRISGSVGNAKTESHTRFEPMSSDETHTKLHINIELDFLWMNTPPEKRIFLKKT